MLTIIKSCATCAHVSAASVALYVTPDSSEEYNHAVLLKLHGLLAKL